MNTPTRILGTCRIATALALAASLGATLAPASVRAEGPDVMPATKTDAQLMQLAICLDTSGSMDGLIDAAKQKLWAVINDLALADPTPRLEVALLTFGNDGHAEDQGWVEVQTPFTEDLDLVSQKLFDLTTNGGTELVGRVLHHTSALDWHPSTDTLKLVIIAGNESADQDTEVPYPEACRALITQGVMVNSIYCGPETDEIAPDWRQVALLADGQFASIDKDQGTIVVETPFDAELGALSTKLNTTYLPYGKSGETKLANQQAQDWNAASLNSAAVAARCSTKASAIYSCGTWDLVDASKDETFELESVAVEELPEVMQTMTPAERVAHVETMRDERAALQASITEVTAKRQPFVEAEMKRLALDDSKSFDRAIRKAIRAQAATKGFRFAEPEPVVEIETTVADSE